MATVTYRTALVGAGLGASLSPALHQAAYAAAGVEGRYRLHDIEEQGEAAADLPTIFNSLLAEELNGFNVTHPFKTRILPLLDEVSPDAAATGAVNTVAIRDGRTTGHNTDWLGFRALWEGLKTGEGPVLVLGAGGAGRAVIHALRSLKVTPVLLFDPDVQAAESLCRDFAGVEPVSDVSTAAERTRTIVNASTVGMHGRGGLPLPAEALTPHHAVAEVVYFPLETPLVLSAREIGCEVATGDTMCFEQAAAAFELMNGLAADRKAMSEAFKQLL